MTPNINQWVEYIDDDIIVVNKPGGLPSVPGNNPYYPHNLYHLLLDQLPPIYVVHRLDILTSGLILFARNKIAQRQLSIAFQNRQIDKRYHALLDGHLTSNSGEISLPIISDWYQKPYQKLCFDSGKPSTTRYKRISLFKHSTLVEFNPITGRSHQLRVHANLLGHPIIGCELYGQRSLWLPANSQPKPKPFGSYGKEPSLMLHASQLQLLHPISQRALNFKSAAKFPTD
ncbi:RluA family pseudouridine synthase [Pleionea mediterranea]|uniref:Ribosomal large subunit pseudouridine synthase A n=1 Tax=Pleionea mediterranea TaxID=523701 RepID=A0A316FLZ7_9GAMM|nr:RluA family pseudouridine synthase [Pleionea mediterranea]PWK49303.1 ribosomal large subunit pseudouridine synthase A [Pleionea mediterranea]